MGPSLRGPGVAWGLRTAASTGLGGFGPLSALSGPRGLREQDVTSWRQEEVAP